MLNLAVNLSKRAERQLQSRTQPLVVVLELYFSCLIRKRVLFPESVVENGITVQSPDSNLLISFLPVMSTVCSVNENPDGPPLSAFPIKSPEKFSPSWLKIDYKGGRWQGEFGYN